MQKYIEPEVITEADKQLNDDDMSLIKVFFEEYMQITDELEGLSFRAISRECGVSTETARKQFSCPSSGGCAKKAKPLFERKRELTEKREKCSPAFIAEKFYISTSSARRLYARMQREADMEANPRLKQCEIESIKLLAEQYWPLKKQIGAYTVQGMADMLGIKKRSFEHSASGKGNKEQAADVNRLLKERDRLRKMIGKCGPRFVSEKYGVSAYVAQSIFDKARAEK